MFVRLKRQKRKHMTPNVCAMQPYGLSRPRPKAQIAKSHYKQNERRPGMPAMPPANRGRNADSQSTT
jgi:hypothetical protein